MIYICPNCGKQYAHKGDFEKHTTKRQKSCVRPTEQSLADRLRVIEAALMAVGQLNPPIVEETPMNYPPSRTTTVSQGVIDYAEFMQNWLTANNMRPRAAEMAKSNRHAVLDEIMEKYHMYDLMKLLSPKAKVADKKSLIEQYFLGNFTNPGGENVSRVNPIEQAEIPVPVVPVERPLPVIHYAPDRIFREPDVDRTREKAAEDKLFALLVSCENDLRPECVGAEAQNTIMQLLVIKVIQPILEQSDILDAEKYGYDKREIGGPLVGCALLKNLVQVESMGISSVFRRVIDYIYTRHPLTRGVFMDHYYATLPDIKFKKVLMKLYEFQFDPESHDVLGSAYQRFVYESNKSNVGSRLGQHFTPNVIVKLMMSLNRQFCVKGGSVCDPFMGTGGILMRAYNTVGRPSPDKIFGTEITRNVYQCAAANIALSTGTIPQGLRCADAFDTEGQFDNIFTNPPFGIKGMRLKILGGGKTSDCDALCANMLMDRLAPGGVCSFVWIKGKILTKMDKAMQYIRKRLFENFEVIGIVMVPGNVFDYTPIKTVIVTFRNTGKKNDWLTFYQYNPNSIDMVDVIGSYDVDHVKRVGYALSPKAYKPKKTLAANSQFTVKQLGDVCMINGGSSLHENQFIDGEFPVIGGGTTPRGYHNTFNTEPNVIMVSYVGNSAGFVSRYDKRTFAAVNVFRLQNTNINNDYLYYYLKYIKQTELIELGDGGAQKSINMTQLREFEIHVPSPERQIELAQIMEQIDSAIIQTRQLLEVHRRIHDEFVSRPFLFAVDCPITALGKICKTTTGPSFRINQISPGQYPVIGGGIGSMGMHNEFNTDENTIMISRIGSAGYVSRYERKVFATENVIKVTNIEIDREYLYYYLKYMRQRDIFKLVSTTCQPAITQTKICDLEIHLPPPEIMQQCVDFFYQTRDMLQRMEEDEQNLLTIIARYEEAIRMYFPPE